MANNNLAIDLKKRKDKDGQTFYVAKLKAPLTVDCSKGVVFLVFTSDNGLEQLQIAPMDNKSGDE
jgi:hypothetical protein